MNKPVASLSAGARTKMAVAGATKFYQTKNRPGARPRQCLIEVREGEFLCIIGPSGCGKTTLLWSMAGLHPLSSGRITIGAETITRPHPEIAMIFQDANLLPWRRWRRTSTCPSS